MWVLWSKNVAKSSYSRRKKKIQIWIIESNFIGIINTISLWKNCIYANMCLSMGSRHCRLSENICFSAWLWVEIKETLIFFSSINVENAWLISDCYFAPIVLPIIRFLSKSDSFICSGYNHMNYRFHLDSSHLSQWEVSFYHFQQRKITAANMNEESRMFNYTADLCYLWTFKDLVPCSELCPAEKNSLWLFDF